MPLRKPSPLTDIVRNPTRAFAPTNLPDADLAAQISGIDVGATAGIHLGADDLDDAIFLAGSELDAVPVGNEPFEPFTPEIVLYPEIHLNGHGAGDVLVDLGLDAVLPLALDQTGELARRAVWEVAGLELVEARHLRLEEVPDGGAEDVAGRVQAGIQQTLLDVEVLRHRVTDGEGLCGFGEPPEMEDLSFVRRGHAHRRHGEHGPAGVRVDRPGV